MAVKDEQKVAAPGTSRSAGRLTARGRMRRTQRRILQGILAVLVALNLALSLAPSVYFLDVANHFRSWITLVSCVAMGAAWLACGRRTGWLVLIAAAVVLVPFLRPGVTAAVRNRGNAAGETLSVVSSGHPVSLSAQAARVFVAPGRRSVTLAMIDLAGPVCVVSINPNTARTEATWRQRNLDLALVGYWLATQCPVGAERIVIGDWNTSPWSGHFAQFLERNDLIWANASLWPAPTRVLAPPFAWLGAPIDHIAISPGLKALECRPLPREDADHRAMTCEIARQAWRAPSSSKRRGAWRGAR